MQFFFIFHPLDNLQDSDVSKGLDTRNLISFYFSHYNQTRLTNEHHLDHQICFSHKHMQYK